MADEVAMAALVAIESLNIDAATALATCAAKLRPRFQSPD